MAVTYLRDIRAYLAREYGVRGATVESGSKHPKLVFQYAGTVHWMTIQNPTNDRGGAANMKLDIRRLLGPPPRPTAQQPQRSLADMTQTLEARAPGPITTPPIEDRTYEGRVSLLLSPSSPNPRLRIQIPPELYRAFGNGEKGVEVRRLSDDEFEVFPNPKVRRPHFAPIDHSSEAAYAFVSERAVPPPLPPEARFGASRAECVLVDGHIMVRVLEHRRQRVSAAERKEAAEFFSGTDVSVKLAPVSLEAELRAAIATIRHVEAETPYRLIRVKDDAGGHWAFSAPRIE